MDETAQQEQQAASQLTQDVTCAYILSRLRTRGTKRFEKYQNSLDYLLRSDGLLNDKLYQYVDALTTIGETHYDKTDFKILGDYVERCWDINRRCASIFLNEMIGDVFSDGKGSWARIAGILRCLYKMVKKTLLYEANLQVIADIVEIWILAFNCLPVGPKDLYLAEWLSSVGGWDTVLAECDSSEYLSSPLQGVADDGAELADDIPLQSTNKANAADVEDDVIPFQSMESAPLTFCLSPSAESIEVTINDEHVDEMLPKATTITTIDVKCLSCGGYDLTYIDKVEKVGECTCGRWRCLYPGCKSTKEHRKNVTGHQRTKHKIIAGSKGSTPNKCKCGNQKTRDKPVGICKCGRYYCAIDNCEKEYPFAFALYKHQREAHLVSKKK